MEGKTQHVETLPKLMESLDTLIQKKATLSNGFLYFKLFYPTSDPKSRKGKDQLRY